MKLTQLGLLPNMGEVGNHAFLTSFPFSSLPRIDTIVDLFASQSFWNTSILLIIFSGISANTYDPPTFESIVTRAIFAVDALSQAFLTCSLKLTITTVHNGRLGSDGMIRNLFVVCCKLLGDEDRSHF